MGFGVSCCVHLALAIALSLIAIGTGTVEVPSLMVSASAVGDPEELILIPANDWTATPDLPESSSDSEPLTMDFASLSQLSISPLSVAVSPVKQPVALAEVASVQESAEPVQQSKSIGTELAGASAVAVAAIQKRVTKAGGKRGEVQFALAWKDVNDVDLHVIAPSGEHISHVHRRSKCAGMLDVDMNVEGESEEPVENVRWISNAPMGRYTVLVNFFKLNSEGVKRPRRQSPYQLLVQLGNESLVRESVAGFGEKQVTVWRFHFIPNSFSSLEREQLLSQLELLQIQEESSAAPMLQQAQVASGTIRQRILQTIVQTYPHTDAAIEAMQLMEGEVVKRARY